jgi:putative transposase
MGRRGYPPEFRRKVLDLVEAGRPIAEVAKALGNERPIDLFLAVKTASTKASCPAGAATSRRSWWRHAAGSPSWRSSWRSPVVPPSCSRSRPPRSTVRSDPGDGHPRAARAGLLPGAGGFAVRLLRLAQPATIGTGHPSRLAHRGDPPGACRLPPDPRAAGGSTPSSPWAMASRSVITPWSCRLCRAGLQGVTGRPKFRRGLRPEATAADRVQRQFTRAGTDQLWVTDITEHPPAKASSPARSCWMPARAGWWAGRSTPHRPRRW